MGIRALSLFSFSSCLLINGCLMVGPDFKQPKLDIAKDWQYTSRKTNASIKEAQNKTSNWWKVFNDKTLNALIQKGYENNLTLQSSGVNLLYTRAALAKSIGELYPQQQNLNGNYTYTRIGASSLESVLPNNFYTATAGLSANWEIDFWGKYRRAIQANDANFIGAMASYDNALTSLIAEIAQTYINIRTEENLIYVTQQNIKSQEESTHIARQRYRLGQTSQLDVAEADTQLGQTKSKLPSQLADLQSYKNDLALLLAITPNDINGLLKENKKIPSPPQQIEVGIPKEVLAQRPDVAEARLKAIAYIATLGQTVAELYPAFSLGGSFSFASNSINQNSVNDLFVWSRRQINAGPSLVFPILNYGQIRNSIRMQDALYQESLLNYQNVVLTAQKEVATAISNYLQAKAAKRILAKTAISARLATKLSIIRYQNGETDYTSVLDAQREQLSVESNLVRAKGNIDLSLSSLYRALGGGWQLRANNDVITNDIKTEMAERTNWGGLLEPKNHLPISVSPAKTGPKLLPTW